MRSNKFNIAHHSIGKDSPCFVIAEAGVAHFGDINKAKCLVDMAVDARADAVKFQIFDVDRMISKEAQEWKDRLGDRCLTGEEFRRLKAHCDWRGIIFLATPHDDFGLETLIDLEVPAYKIGSGEINNWQFIKRISQLGRPVILSTGMYELADIHRVVEIFEKTGNNEVALLHCVTAYPTPVEDINLNVLSLFRKEFGGVIGYSDHSHGSHIPLAAVALGADIVEKHITLDFDVPNAQDWKVSCGPTDLVEFIRQLREVESSLGQPCKLISKAEVSSKDWASKSLVVAYEHKVGDEIRTNSLLCKRPGTGISPSQIDEVLGKKLVVDLSTDSILRWEHFE